MHVRYMSVTLGTTGEAARQSSSGNEYSDGTPPKSLTSPGSGVTMSTPTREKHAHICVEAVTKASNMLSMQTSRQDRMAVTVTIIHIVPTRGITAPHMVSKPIGTDLWRDDPRGMVPTMTTRHYRRPLVK